MFISDLLSHGAYRVGRAGLRCLLVAASGLIASAPGFAESEPVTVTKPAPLGVYVGPGCYGVKSLQRFETWFGKPPQRGSDFISDASWVEMLKAAERGSKCWAPTGLPMEFAVPMLPRDKSSTLAEGARGDYDTYYVRIAETYVRNGFPTAVIRIGWEFNHDWFTWAAAKDPKAWVAYWRRIVTAMRSVPGAQFRFDWCPAWSKGQIAPPEVYPGDDYVDIIGLDIYNTTWNPMSPQQRWALKVSAPYGLQWQKDFAAAHGKPISFPEWGTGLRPDGRGGGDDPFFIRKMAAWIANAPVEYHNYWDYPAPDFKAILSDGSQPEAGAAFLKVFGGEK